MAARFSDQEIGLFVAEPKVLPEDYRRKLVLRDKRGHREAEMTLSGASGSEFRLIARQNRFNVLDFSIILAVCPATSHLLFRLRRYNGKSHEHTNRIEGDSFYDFHIHMATERYQDLGIREDGYAEPTTRFGDYESAFQCMLEDCEFETPPDAQLALFDQPKS